MSTSTVLILSIALVLQGNSSLLFHIDRGRPNSALYFIGYQNDSLIYLDPHVVRPSITLKDNYSLQDLETYHCKQLKTLPINSMDPSLVIGFLLKSKNDLEDFILCSKSLVQGKTPLFSIEESIPDYENQHVEIISDEEFID